MPHIIDSHAHLNWDVFAAEMDALLQRAADASVREFIHPCVELSDWDSLCRLRRQYAQIYICLGVHPYHVDTWSEQHSADQIRQHRHDIVAIGETGLDYSSDAPDRQHQRKVFIEHCRLAVELDLPLIVHCRDAFDDVLNILQQENIHRGVMHCFTGSTEHARQICELGMHISFSGCLTFKNAHNLRTTAKTIPSDKLLVETDCPFLAPQGRRGQRNEPAYIVETLQMLAELQSVTTEQMINLTYNNTRQLFRLPQ